MYVSYMNVTPYAKAIFVHRRGTPEQMCKMLGPSKNGIPSESVWLVPGTFDEDGRCILPKER